MRTLTLFAAVVTALAGAAHAGDSALPEFEVKRRGPFEFARKPTVTRDGDRVTIRFTAKAYCDATLAIEDADGKIVRHLASGVLGQNAPKPFQRNSLDQAVVWDGKDDRGVYIDEADALAVRVSLGLRPRFERNLLWEPKRRVGRNNTIAVPAPEGVYVYEGEVVDSLRLFDHDGNYVRTVYPFPADKLASFKDLHWRTFPQDGARLPMKEGFHQATLLSSGKNAGYSERFGGGIDVHNNHHGSVRGHAATAVTVRNGKAVLAQYKVNAFRSDGSSLGPPMAGAKTWFPAKTKRWGADRVFPRSAALSPDGKRLYLTGYVWCYGGGDYGSRYEWLHAVVALDLEKGDDARAFAGSLTLRERGSGADQLYVPSSVDCDAAGRVYVSDYLNDRVQVFKPDGELVKSIRVSRPARVAVHQRTGHVYVFSWHLTTRHHRKLNQVPARLVHFGPADDPRRIAAYPLPIRQHAININGNDQLGGLQFRAALDSWSERPRVWLGVNTRASVKESAHGTLEGMLSRMSTSEWDNQNILILEERDGGLEKVRRFGAEVKRSVKKTKPPLLSRERLYVNPANGKLYVADGGKNILDLLEIEPETGRVRIVPLPMDAEDLAFDVNGLLYLRARDCVGRFNLATSREVPWDYGEERARMGHRVGRGGRQTHLLSALALPRTEILWHQSGMWVSRRGRLVTNHYCVENASSRDDAGKPARQAGKPYTPPIYPGRVTGIHVPVFHVWDRHGKLVHRDAAPGLTVVHGVALDADDNVYVATQLARRLGDRRPFNPATNTVMKFGPGKGRVLSSKGCPVPLGRGQAPERPADLSGGGIGRAWAEGVEWLYGGVGFAGGNARGASGCSCWNMRFGFDYFARSFLPETDQYRFAVLDSAGNVITRIGRYGNADDGVPLVKAGASPAARPIGGDEVALFHACYAATHSDRRLFIADAGNFRILSVKLGYHATEAVALNDVPNEAP